MKFSCERCGKKYATADKPVPGRVYKLKCKACGHLIVVRPSAADAPPAPAPGVAASAPVRPAADHAAPPEVTLEIGTPEAATPTPLPVPVPAAVELAAAAPAPLPAAVEPTQEVSARADDGFELKAGDTGYVDLFADGGGTGGAALRGEVQPPAEAPAPDDPFLAAASAAAPEAQPAPPLDADPFAGIRAELAAVAAAEAPKPDTSPPIAAPKVPEIPRPPPQKHGSPVLLIGAGTAVLVGILVFALVKFGGERKPEPTPAPPPQQRAVAAPEPAPAPAPPPPAAEPPAPQPEPVAVRAEEPRPQPPPRPEPRPEPKRRPPERTARAEPKPEPKPEPRPPPPPPREERNVDLPEASEGLSEAQIQRVLSSTRKAFDDCISSAGKDSDVKLDGRKVVLRLNIQPNGTVTYPTIDDVQLNATPLGGCLKQAARLMVFPKFSGDPLRIEVPLTLNER